MAKKKKKSTKKPVQTTLGAVVEEKSKKKKTTKKTPAKKKAAPKKTTKKPAKKEAAKKKTTPAKKKTTTKKAPTKKKKASKKKPAAKKPKPIPPEEGDIPLSSLPGVGGKLSERLRKAGYVSVEKISRARSASLAKKVEGLSKSGATKLVADAKRALKPITKSPDEEDVDAEQRPSLAEIPGVGGKMAMSLESAGYNSIARLSRASPSGVAKRVDGLGLDKATRIIAAARKYMKDKERSAVMGEPETVIVTSKKTQPTKKETPSKKEEAKPEPEKPKADPKKKTPAPKKAKKRKKRAPKKKPKPPPKRTKPKVVRKKSGLPVPKAVEKFAVEMKAKW
ncbi:MAG: helix-hairpin-helix domain-containing protein, partial [Candidatus Thorarchaeota archaeon]